MSKAISALNGRVAVGDVSITDLGLRGMISLRGDLNNKAVVKACQKAAGAVMPAALKMTSAGNNGIGWMAADEALLLVAHDHVTETLEALDKALSGNHYLASNVSDARALIAVTGAGAAEIIAKLAPVDLHPDSFQVGDFRRSRLGQVAAAFWKVDAQTFHVICFRSVADYAFDLLAASAQAGPVGHFA